MPHLDALRFVAALGVVIYHFKHYLSFAAHPVVQNLDGLRQFVDLFFAISGVVIVRYYGSVRTCAEYRAFLWRRVGRLGPLHWATALIFALGYLALGFAHQPGEPGNYDFTKLIPNLLGVHAWLGHGQSFNYVSWSVSAEWLMYLALPVVLWARTRRLLLLLIASSLIALTLSGPWLEWTTAARAVPSFLFGAWLASTRALRLPYASAATWALLVAFIAACAAGAPALAILGIAWAIVGAAMSADESPHRAIALRVAPMGALTYSLYMLHPLVGIVAVTLFAARWLGLSGVALDVWVAACALSTLGLAWLSLDIFERPARRWLNTRSGVGDVETDHVGQGECASIGVRRARRERVGDTRR
jgi:peptidoglycan/LPS O-acetylase OafA/YrhL